MKLIYPTHPEHPITSKEEFLRRRIEASEKRDWRPFTDSVPRLLIACCPFCDRELWMPAGLMFSLTDNFWFRGYCDGRSDVVDDESVCEHLFCIDGALNLNGHLPSEARKWHKSYIGDGWEYIWVASEVPFVKPRVLNLPIGMVAVMYDFPVDNKYTAYPIVYFAEEPPYPDYREDFCIPWATKIYMDNHGSGYYLSGNREDAQDYDLKKWVQQEKLYWLDAQSYTLTHGVQDAFPYLSVTGRQHPYKIVEGEVFDLPGRDKDGKPKFQYSD